MLKNKHLACSPKSKFDCGLGGRARPLPISGKLVAIHVQHPQSIEKFQQKLVYP